jgi:hypothetical protein
MQNIEEKGTEAASVEQMFLGMQESYAEAQARAVEENRAFARTEFFRFDKLGVYRLRILPIAPSREDAVERKGYEYPIHQMLMELERPGGGKQPGAYVTVCRATEAGYSVDIIDTYRRLAVEAAKEAGEEKLAEKIGGGSFGGGLRFSYCHAMYVIDLNDRAKGIQLMTLSHAQFKELDERKFKLWQKKIAKNPLHGCPVSSPYGAYPVEIEKRKNGGKTEYSISIDNESDNAVLTLDEMNLLMNTPRIPEITGRYTRYHFEATVEFLRQCDDRYELRVMETEDMAAAIETLKGEIPGEDTSSFSFDKKGKDDKESAGAGAGAITLDVLYDRHDRMREKGLGDKTEEGQELRSMIRTFIEQEKLPVRVTRQTSNGELLDMIDDVVNDYTNGGDGADSGAAWEPEEAGGDPDPDQDPDPDTDGVENERPARRRR